jgi:hypothetical protein
VQVQPYPLRGAGFALSSLAVELYTVLGRHRNTTHYVDSNASGDADGQNWDDAYTTIEAAVNVAAVDDRILVAPLHVETVTAAAGLELNVAGITVVGLGNGDRRPQINFTTATGADVNVGAADVTVVNVRFTGGIDALTGPIDVNAAGFTMIDCVTQDVTGQATDWIVLDASADFCRMIRPTHRGASAAGADTWLTAVGCDELTVEDLVADGNFAVGIVELVGTACTKFKLYGNANRPSHLHTRNSADIIFDDVVTGSTVDCGPGLYCMLADNASGTLAEMTVANAGQFWDPIEMVNLAGESSIGSDITIADDL